jgi:hypothetical protein
LFNELEAVNLGCHILPYQELQDERYDDRGSRFDSCLRTRENEEKYDLYNNCDAANIGGLINVALEKN